MVNVIKDIDFSDLPSDKEYTYKGTIENLSDIPKDANIYDLYTFIDDSFVYARKDDHTLYCIMNPHLNLNNETSDLPSDSEAKLDHGKPKLTLVPRQIIFDIARIREYGVKKYKDPDNWKRVSVERYRDAAFRHFMSYLDDPYGVDEESGLPHLAHLACNIAFLCELQKQVREYDELVKSDSVINSYKKPEILASSKEIKKDCDIVPSMCYLKEEEYDE